MNESEQIVYISCVEEVRYSFVSHLFEALSQKGIPDVFVDSGDLLSNESQSKVERSRVSVIVLPGNRKVCLDKLVKVLECQGTNDQVVVPVLYGNRTVEAEWLSALDLRGFPSVHQSSKECSDSKLVNEIVKEVYEKLFYMERIGIYSKLVEIENMVCKQPLGTHRLGIWGMPGIGKTTLAKAVFDQMSRAFDASCFIEDYDKAIQEKGLYCLLEEQFLKEKHGADGTTTKLSLLRNKLNNKRVLVVLDNVRNPLVAEPFLGGFDWFGPKSLIIITSRDKQVLRLCRVNQIYEVKGLNEKEALQLFLLCASIKDMGEQNLHELSVKVVKHANGHPLALSIYGRELKYCKRKLSEMETAFLKLKLRPPFKIFEAFKSSYDTLNDSEKNIFLDIACFFNGENVDYVMQLLEGCGFFPHVGIDVLVGKCLVTISENRVWMHNLIQDVGRKIVSGETVQIERRSRLWEPWSIKYLLEDNEGKANREPKKTFKRSQGTKEIEGMFLDASKLSFDANPDSFENMIGLRMLKIYYSNKKIHPVINFPKGFFHSLPNELRLLHWDNYPLKSLPQKFDPRHLVEINMPNSQLHKLWGGTKTPEMLRTIRLCHSQQLVDIDDVLKAQNLEVIDLQGCARLKSFPGTSHLLHLRVVNLSGCTEIQSFPELPPNIETLRLQGTGIMELSTVKPNGAPDIMSLLEELQGLSDVLRLQRITSLISSSCQYLGKLIFLDLKDCSRLESLPNMINLKSLEVLDLSGCLVLKAIQGFPQNLKELYIIGTAELNKPLAFSFCVPSHVDQNFTPCLKSGSSVLTRLSPSWRNTLVGFAILVEVAFPEDYYDVTGLGIRCICRWKNKEGRSQSIERNLHCWVTGEAVPKVQKDHMFVFFDAKMRPSTDEGNDPDIYADLVVFEFFTIDKQKKRRLDDSCTVKRCGVYAIDAANGDTSLRMSSSDSFWHSIKIEENLRTSYDGLPEMSKVFFLYIACLFNDEDVDLVAPLIANIDMDVSSGIKVLSDRSLIHVSSNGDIAMDSLLRRMGKEILHTESMLLGSSKDIKTDLGKIVSMGLSSSHDTKCNVFLSFNKQDIQINFLNYLIAALKEKVIPSSKNDGIEITKAAPESQFKISFVLFTINYASSSWLLNELVGIANSSEDLSHMVVPVFHPDVNPLDVKEQTGEFGRRFEEICKNKTENEKQQWRRALTNISSIGRYKITYCDSSDEEFIKSMVKEVKDLMARIRIKGKPSRGVISQGVVFVVPARSLDITHSENPKLWTWGYVQSEAGIEIAKLNKIYGLQIKGYFVTRKLTPGTKYKVVFMIYLDDTASGWEEPVTLNLKLKHRDGSQSIQESTVCLNDYVYDNWVDIQAGEFEALPENVVEIFFSLHQYEYSNRKSGLLVKGVAIRPTEEVII
ncbi:Toll/interleukin-1 receptor homology (TIR) domain [Arabidopsis suecica]|uniref:Toll/interleukin-1 receptor homology (TIR) domain n=1 Tax=Arabidopsis suecica TaxID=45249 RepID=A0A8T1XWR0_ARASU|nr:Toll/interleukin-1 receptor homology (TIR) domain [Arabidopsis suecica]